MSRKHRNGTRPLLSTFTFSPEMVKLLQEAMKVFSQSLTRAADQPEKVAFASETVQQINEKLAAMLTSIGVMCLTGFDYNEKLVIAAAIQLYLLEPLTASVSSQREKKLKQCQQLMRFALDPGRKPVQ